MSKVAKRTRCLSFYGHASALENAIDEAEQKSDEFVLSDPDYQIKSVTVQTIHNLSMGWTHIVTVVYEEAWND